MQSILKKGISQNKLKILAAITMLTDHVGAEFFSEIILLRIIGRLAFPIFSYFIFEGFYHTRNRRRYFLKILFWGMLCMTVYYIYSGEIYGNVLITFSFSMILLFCVELWKEYAVRSINKKICVLICIGISLGFIWFVCSWIYIDYGISGVFLPVLAELTSAGTETESRYLPLTGFSVGLLLLSVQTGGIQYFCLLAIPLLFIYNRQRGTRDLKAFFYWFYPLHLAVIGMIATVMK